ncbi:hypothetical protein B0J13DRAFT_538565 [Dactylonectria estremocensis]|uniref:Uncharacterized protein n=1 Tax=Dactylonectria estremocensis TaxID=1079267 RepID=A0A9P9FKP2_9HYPO|nr:hypothetical protein B0J13DRAFT_538565 [Dactylonectria estremocensis]
MLFMGPFSQKTMQKEEKKEEKKENEMKNKTAYSFSTPPHTWQPWHLFRPKKNIDNKNSTKIDTKNNTKRDPVTDEGGLGWAKLPNLPAKNLTRQWDTAEDNDDSRPVLVKSNRVDVRNVRDSDVEGLVKRFVGGCIRAAPDSDVEGFVKRIASDCVYEGPWDRPDLAQEQDDEQAEKDDGVSDEKRLNVRRDNIGLDVGSQLTHPEWSIAAHQAKPFLTPGYQIFLGLFLTFSFIVLLYMTILVILHCAYPREMRHRRPWTLRRRKATPVDEQQRRQRLDLVVTVGVAVPKAAAATRGRVLEDPDEGLESLPATVPRSMV